MQRRLATALIMMAMLSTIASAGPREDLVARWYLMLLQADAGGLSALLADDARIQLNDIGVEQTKTEFLDSMGEWAVAASGATIRHRIETTLGDVITVLACYDFESNDMLIRETFTFSEDLVVNNAQTAVAETCKAY